MYGIRSFTHNGKRYELCHDNNTDGRAITERGESEKPLIEIDSSLYIRKDGKVVGHMWGYRDTWILEKEGVEIDLGVLSNNHGYRELEFAEIEAAKHYI